MNKHKYLKNFYAIEGIGGAGKTSIISKIKDICSQKFNFHFTQEPTNGSIGLFIKQIIQDRTYSFTSKTLEHLLYADRFEHIYGKGGVASLLLDSPSCSNHKVICDSYLLTSAVYQGTPFSILGTIFPLPAIFFFIDAPLNKVTSRVKGTKGELDKDTLCRIRNKYVECLNSIDFTKIETKLVVLDNSVPNDIERNAKRIIKAIVCKEYLHDLVMKNKPLIGSLVDL
ncbi:dTMP kinase [Candidatus Borreliella tachyglossi]|uniref:dTMP kinase n=1 Tax=Candidatus Borreliella tachyglossi TaxID=1964448 RepID=UPI00404147EA